VTVVFLLALPATASAATVSVVPYADPPDTDPFGSCARYMQCPPDMIVFTAGKAENNHAVVTMESSAYPRYRFVVRDRIAQLQAGPGCEQLDFQTAACTAGAVGPVRLGDGDDWFASGVGAGDVHGGAGQDVLQHIDGRMFGGAGDDVIAGSWGAGGGGADVLTVGSGAGESGDDVLRCFPRDTVCSLDGGSGDDRLTGGTSVDRLFGGRGDDFIHGGDDRDTLRGGPGADVLVSREERSAARDRVECGAGRRDRAVADRRDHVKRSCERVARRD
jgi:hypothetical protein